MSRFKKLARNSGGGSNSSNNGSSRKKCCSSSTEDYHDKHPSSYRSRRSCIKRVNVFALSTMALALVVSVWNGSRISGGGGRNANSNSGILSSFLRHGEASGAKATESQQQQQQQEQQPEPPKPPAIMTDSTNATVMGIATNYGKYVFQQFVGSLRNVGYKGHIILAVSPDLDPDAYTYLISKNVIVKKLEYEDCTHSFGLNDKEGDEIDSHQKEVRTCISPYPLLKHRWGRFPKLRDYLQECESCTGPVLIMDVRDSFFQRDPFGDGQPQVEGLQVFMEHKSITTQHWLVEWPVRECKGITFDYPMLCSGTTIGTRQAMLDYLEIMHQEMLLWMGDPKCHFDTNGDDQSIHNYLYWTGKLPFATAIPNRQGIVHTVGAQGSILHEIHEKFHNEGRDKGIDAQFVHDHSPLREVHPHSLNEDQNADPKNKQWMKLEYDLIDEQGFILDYDGNRSAVVHQYDRYGAPLQTWLEHWSGLVDKN